MKQLKFKSQFSFWDCLAVGAIIAIIFSFLSWLFLFIFSPDIKPKNTVKIYEDGSFSPAWAKPFNQD